MNVGKFVDRTEHANKALVLIRWHSLAEALINHACLNAADTMIDHLVGGGTGKNAGVQS